MRDGAEELLQTYTEDGGINYLAAAAMLPSRSAIDAACAELMSLMFPGFRGEPLFDSSDLPEVTRSRLRSLLRPKPEFCKALANIRRRPWKSGRGIACGFFSQLPAVRKMLK